MVNKFTFKKNLSMIPVDTVMLQHLFQVLPTPNPVLFFVALFITFLNLAHHTYSCIGTSGKNWARKMVKTIAESI